MLIHIPNHWTEVSDPYGGIRGQIEGAEVEDNSIGIPAVSTKLDIWEHLEVESYTWAGMRHPGKQIGLPGLASVGGVVSHP